MGQSCLRPPRPAPAAVRKREAGAKEKGSAVSASTSRPPTTFGVSIYGPESVAEPVANVQQPTVVTNSHVHVCSHNACTLLRKKDWEAAERMLETGEGLDVAKIKLLERALYEGCPAQLVFKILDSGINPAQSSRCLSDAIIGQADYSVIERLLDCGCSPNTMSDQDKLKRTPLHFACQKGTPQEVIDLLLERGGDVNMRVGDRQWTPLHFMASSNHDPLLLAKLVDRGANINATARDGTTPMAVAAFKHAPEIFFRKMLGLGANPALQTLHGRTPLYYLRNSKMVIHPSDVRVVILDPEIHRRQLVAFAHGLNPRFGRESEVLRLNKDLLALIGEFILGWRPWRSGSELTGSSIESDVEREDSASS